MGKSHFKKAIASLEARIAEHQDKIRLELEKESPDYALIRHWHKEVKAFEKEIQQALITIREKLMQTINREIDPQSDTLNRLMLELRDDCQNVTALVNRLMTSGLTNHQKGDLLAELFAATIHLQAHCSEDFQNLILEKLESLD